MSNAETVWLVDDDPSIRWVLERALGGVGFATRSFDTGAAMLEAIGKSSPDVVMSDIRMPGINGLELMQQLQHDHPQLPVIIMTAHADLDHAVSAYQGGAFEYLAKPFDIDHAVDLVRRAVANRSERDTPAMRSGGGTGILGKAPAMQQVFRAIGRLANSSVSVLITGETGTGKELVARALHENSPRRTAPFVALNTSAIPADLLESELFGHEKGSFTGAASQRRGRFEQADGGTLFLDEIGDMPPALQTRLLRVLAEGEFYRVGGQSRIKVDVRVIAATHQNLDQRIARGDFREDLYHRLNVVRIELPPLRERREDIPDLLLAYLQQAADELGMPSKQLTAAARDALMTYAWPGNVRELVNLCRRLTALAPGARVTAEDLPASVTGKSVAVSDHGWVQALISWAEAADARTPLLDQALPQFERALLQVALKRCHGHRQDAARLLGWGRNTLTRKAKELGI
ncbi:MAG: nitrogen regulation protein NR(I) [Steroidobacteraceae bacterium]